MSSEPDLEVASQQKQERERPDKSENNHPQVCKALNLNFWFYIVFPAFLILHVSSETLWVDILKSIEYNLIFSFYKILRVTKLKMLWFLVTKFS